MQQPSGKMRELRTALTVALGLAIASFGTARDGQLHRSVVKTPGP